MTRRREALALSGIVALALLLRLGACGADVPLHDGISYAPVQDAFWYMEAAVGAAEGYPVEAEPVYDVPVWVPVARVWLEVWGASWTSACALAAVWGAVLVVATWRLARAALGPVAGLSSALVLATLYPQVIQSRVPLIYGPLAVWLLAAAAVWLSGRGQTPLRRAACELLAWGMVLGAVVAVRPPAAAFLGGLAAAHCARLRRGRQLFAAGAAALLVGLGLLAALGPSALEPPLRVLGWLAPESAGTLRYRLGLHLAERLDLSALALRALGFFGPLGADRGSGYAELAPGACSAAGLGAVLVLARWWSLRPAARELLALLLGTLATFVVGGLLMEQRPLRYFLLVGPTLAVCAGCVVSWTLSERWRLPGLEVRAATRRAVAGLVLAVAVAGGLARGVGLLLGPTWASRTANRLLPRMLGPNAVTCGPYASSLLIGSGLPRLRGTWVRTDPPPQREATLGELRSRGVTHLVVDVGQERNGDLLANFAASGVRLRLIGVLITAGPGQPGPGRLPGAPVLVLRLPWAERDGYEPSDYELRQTLDEQGRGPPEGELELLLARVRALVRGDADDRAQALDLCRRSLGANPALGGAQPRMAAALAGW